MMMSATKTDSRGFFQDLRPFYDLLEFSHGAHYVSAPRDWHLVISDVRGSTQAIEGGRYKTVNMIGASTIAAISNTLRTLTVPMVFGGDGATVLIPPHALIEVKRALRAVRAQSTDAFGLDLRVGIVPVADILHQGHRLEVAKFGLPGGPVLAFFRGPGLDIAEGWVKSGLFSLEDGEKAEIDKVLAGLSCRWAPIPNARGLILTLLIKARGSNAPSDLLTRVATFIHQVVDFSSTETHPVKVNRMKAERLLKATSLEARLTRSKGRFFYRLMIVGIIGFVALMRRFGTNKNSVRT
jgi:Protein of unknown function (DUF3095)